jgi:thiol-disulfide isomerase/thioredoxin
MVKSLTVMPVFRLIAFCLLCSLLSASFIASAGELKVWSGGRTPPLSLRDIDGKMHDLAAYKGQVVLVNFWATWCEPCRDEMPAIQRLKKKLAGKPFVVLAVNVDEPDSRIRNFLEKMPLDFPTLVDEGKVATRAWKVSVLPASFIIGRDGRIRYNLTGELAWDHDSVVSLLAELTQSR